MFEDEDDDNEVDVRDLPIFKKGREIQDVVRTLAELMPEDNEYLQSLKGEMLYDAGLLTVKIAGAEGAELYDLKMEAATFIRKAACDLKVMNHTLEELALGMWRIFRLSGI